VYFRTAFIVESRIWARARVSRSTVTSRSWLTRTNPYASAAIVSSSAHNTTPHVASTPRFRLANFRILYSVLGGRAVIGSFARYRRTSSASAPHVAYRPRPVLLDRLHHDPVKIPRQRLPQARRVRAALPGHIRGRRRLVPRLERLPTRVLGFCGSASAMIFWISATPALRSFVASSGVEPVSSSYSSTPRL
jgi:hypothetical protein